MDLPARLRLARLLVALNLDGGSNDVDPCDVENESLEEMQAKARVRQRVADALHAMGHQTKRNSVNGA